VDALLAKKPDQRVGSAADLRQRIDELLAVREEPRRGVPALAVVAAVAALALVGALLAWRLWLLTPQPGEQQPPPGPAPVEGAAEP